MILVLIRNNKALDVRILRNIRFVEQRGHHWFIHHADGKNNHGMAFTNSYMNTYDHIYTISNHNRLQYYKGGPWSTGENHATRIL